MKHIDEAIGVLLIVAFMIVAFNPRALGERAGEVVRAYHSTVNRASE